MHSVLQPSTSAGRLSNVQSASDTTFREGARHACRYALTTCRTKAAWLWDLATGACVRVLRLKDGATTLFGTFVCGRYPASGDAGGGGGAPSARGAASAAAAAEPEEADYGFVVTAHASGCVAVWLVATGRQVACFACDTAPRALAASPAGVLCVGTEGGLVHFLRLPLGRKADVHEGVGDDDAGARGPFSLMILYFSVLRLVRLQRA